MTVAELRTLLTQIPGSVQVVLTDNDYTGVPVKKIFLDLSAMELTFTALNYPVVNPQDDFLVWID